MANGDFLKLSGGYVHGDEIRWAELHDDNSLVVSIRSKQRPVVLSGDDKRLVERYLATRLWDPLSTDRQEADS